MGGGAGRHHDENKEGVRRILKGASDSPCMYHTSGVSGPMLRPASI